MRSSLIGDESAVTGSAGQAPDPMHRIHEAVTEAARTASKQVEWMRPALERDTTRPSASTPPLPEEENRTVGALAPERVKRNLLLHPGWCGAITDACTLIDALQAENTALRAERDETLSRLSALQERVERAEKALADAMSSRGGAA